MDTVYILFEAGDPIVVYADPDMADDALTECELETPGYHFYVESFGVIS